MRLIFIPIFAALALALVGCDLGGDRDRSSCGCPHCHRDKNRGDLPGSGELPNVEAKK